MILFINFGENICDRTRGQMVCSSFTEFGPYPIRKQEGGWLYDLYCRQPPGGNRDDLASLFGELSGRPSLYAVYVQNL